MLFTQVYFHKTRVIFDYHLVEALKSILAPHGGWLPTLAGLNEFEDLHQHPVDAV